MISCLWVIIAVWFAFGWVVNSVVTSTITHSLFVNVLCFTSGLGVLIVLFDLLVYLLVVGWSLRLR